MIHKVHKLQTTMSTKNDNGKEQQQQQQQKEQLVVYVKLSSMTGAFWILGLLSEAVDNNPLRYISLTMYTPTLRDNNPLM